MMINYASQKFIQNAIVTVIVVILITACGKSDPDKGLQNAPGIIQVALSGATFSSEETISNRAATNDENTIQRNTIELGKDFLIVAELRPDESKPTYGHDTKAAIETTPLSSNIQYRVLVYNQSGAFVTERDYVRGQESNTAELLLDGGTTYTFVVVSINTTAALPATLPAAVATRTINNSYITTTGGTTELMYYKQTMTVTANTTNRLDIILKHLKPIIITTIDATATGYNITAINADFTPHRTGMRVELVDGSYSQTGTTSAAQPNFTPFLGNQTMTASVGINSLDNSATSFTIRSITIGPLSATNLVPFTTLNVTEGVRYNLILNIVPIDEYITHSGRPAARINGIVWARHNLGVAGTVNTEQTPITSSLHGNFYQFGRTAVVASGTATSTNSNWVVVPNSPQAWNSSETSPVKTGTDPCPGGYRVPTTRELQDLIDNTLHTTKGSMNSSNTNYNSASVLTSKRSASVRLIFPHQGIFDAGGNPVTSSSLTFRGTLGITHTSRTNGNIIYRFRPSSTGVSVSTSDNNVTNYSVSIPIRCVGI